MHFCIPNKRKIRCGKSQRSPAVVSRGLSGFRTVTCALSAWTYQRLWNYMLNCVVEKPHVNVCGLYQRRENRLGLVCACFIWTNDTVWCVNTLLILNHTGKLDQIISLIKYIMWNCNVIFPVRLPRWNWQEREGIWCYTLTQYDLIYIPTVQVKHI